MAVHYMGPGYSKPYDPWESSDDSEIFADAFRDRPSPTGQRWVPSSHTDKPPARQNMTLEQEIFWEALEHMDDK